MRVRVTFAPAWRLTVVAAAAVLAAVPLPGPFVERVYARGVYPRLQPALTAATNLVPFAVLDVLVAGVAAWLVWRLARAWRRGARLRAAAALAWDAAAGAACVYLAFALLWGLNYQRTAAAERFDVQPDRITAARLARLGEIAAARVNALHDPGRDAARLEVDALAHTLQPPFQRALHALRYGWRPAPGRPKASLVARLFPLAGVDGLMNPLALEVIVNPEALPFERPFLLAHEWAHLAGQAGESEASFVAWLVCAGGTREMQYSGWLALLLHVRRSLGPEGERLLASLDVGPRADLDAIRRRLARAEPRITRATWRVYDRYLKANRVESGVANYDEVTLLVLGSPLAAGLLEAEASPAR